MFAKIKIVLLFFFLTGVKALLSQETKTENQNGYNKFYYPSGRLQSEGNLKEGKPEGFWINYFENGRKKSEGNRKNFQLDSIWNFYNEKGILVQSFNYREGKKEGFKRIFEPDSGKLVSEEHFIADLKDGYSFFYKNNYKYKDIPFVKGKENGLGREYNKDGLILTLTTYKNGFLQREERINRRDQANRKQGNWKSFFSSGKVYTESKYLNDKLDGYYKEYNEKGDLITVEGSGGYDLGVVSLTGELVKLQMKKKGVSEKSDEIRRVLHPATEAELDRMDEAKKHEKEMMIRSRVIARDLKLDMKIAEVEVQADGKKATFFYTAEDRVDFLCSVMRC